MTKQLHIPAVLQPLRQRTFGLLWGGQTISLIGDFVYIVALPFQVLALGGSALQIGTVSAVSFATQVVFVLLGGALVDRLPRRLVILVSDLASGLVLAVVASLSAAGALRLEHLYLAAALRGVSVAFFTPAVAAIIPELVPTELLQAGNALRGISRQAGRVGGPLLGRALVASFGPAPAIAVDPVTFFVSFGLLLLVGSSPSGTPGVLPAGSSGLLHEVRTGLAFTFSLPWLWVTIFGFALINVAYSGALAVALPVLVQDRWTGDARTFGALVTFIGVGEVAGGLLVGQWHLRRVGLAMYLFQALSSAALAAVGLAPDLLVALLAAGGVGLGMVGFNILWETAVQHVPPALLGRVTSVDYFGAVLLTPIGPFLVGAAVQGLGPSPVVVAAGLGSAVLALAALLIPSIRRL